MVAVVQRVSRACVRVGEEVSGRIDLGLLVLLGVRQGDDERDAAWMAAKCAGLRIFCDAEGKMNLGLDEVGGEMLVVSQFTLLGDCVKGRRPSFTDAAPPEEANRLYNRFVEETRLLGLRVETGVFQAMMEVELTNNGPVTLWIDSAPWKARLLARERAGRGMEA